MKICMIILLSLHFIILTYAISRKRNCEVEFHKCTIDNDLSSCQTKLGDCIKSQHHNSDMIPKKKRDFMTKFKCCYQTLAMCINKESAKKDVDLRHCSESMLKCAKGGRTLPQFVKEAPTKLRSMFGKYGKCIRTHCLNDCVHEYYNNMEDLLGMDCLNKYINCIYTSGKDKRPTCHNEWKTCMTPTCKDTARPKFQTKLIKGIWQCKKEPSGDGGDDDYVMHTLRCIFELYKDGISMSHWLTIEHVREACFYVYGKDNGELKVDYERCVEKNSKSVDSALLRARNRIQSAQFCTENVRTD